MQGPPMQGHPGHPPMPPIQGPPGPQQRHPHSVGPRMVMGPGGPPMGPSGPQMGPPPPIRGRMPPPHGPPVGKCLDINLYTKHNVLAMLTPKLL